jgi:hypothetical protein
LGYFIHGQTSKISQFDGFAFSLIKFLKLTETPIEHNDIPAALALKADGTLERYPAPSSFEGPSSPGVFYEDLAHQARCHSEEVLAVFPVRIFLIYETNVGLMDDRRGL